MCFPFKDARHAGGKTVSYYIDSFANEADNEVTLIAKVMPDEEKYIDSLNPRIKPYFVKTPSNKVLRVLSYVKSINSKLNPLYKYGNTLTKEIYDQIRDTLKDLKYNEYEPDLIVLEWTPIVLFIDVVKQFFPNAKYIASEHDITFQGMYRKWIDEKKTIRKYVKRMSFESMKKYELNALTKCDLIVTQNRKDVGILERFGLNINKTHVIVPFYQKFVQSPRNQNYTDIIFYGAMNREENSSCAIWFIKNVMPLLKDCDVRFIVIGNNPPTELRELSSDKIIITGFVKDPSEYFINAMCMAAPLQLGAGIKVKIIEALSSGVPVLTNDIGIEGIDAKDQVEYFHCNTPEEYASTIKMITNKEIDISKISINSIALINNQYDLVNAVTKYKNRVYNLYKT